MQCTVCFISLGVNGVDLNITAVVECFRIFVFSTANRTELYDLLSKTIIQ